MGDTIVGVYYRPPDQDKEVDEAFCVQLEVALRSKALVLLQVFNSPVFVGGTTWLGRHSARSSCRYWKITS